MRRLLSFILFLIFFPTSSFSQDSGQETRDSLVRLLTASRVKLVEKDGRSFRRAEGDVRFLHNDTYLYCDTAFWCVEEQYIDAVGNVQIIQDNAVLSSDRLHYDIPSSVASFRGTLVQLEDRDSNILRTNDLDYSTRDSIATFRSGGSMKDRDGNIIESLMGKFESALKLFTFEEDVEMFSDSAFFASGQMKYRTDLEKAFFGNGAKGWYGRNYIQSGGGWYDKKDSKVMFDEQVYLLTDDYEGWCDELLYDRVGRETEMFGNVQLLDSAHNVMAAGGYVRFTDEPRHALLTENPAVIAVQKDSEGEMRDSLFLRADTLVFETLMKFMIPQEELQMAGERLKLLDVDPVANARKNASDEAAAVAAAEERQDRRRGPRPSGGPQGPGRESGVESREEFISPEEQMAFVCDSLTVADSLFIHDSMMVPDSVMIAAMDSVLKNWKDSTEINFMHGYHHVMMFREGLQMVCDSIEYFDVDSIARLYGRPIVWREIKTQIASDSMQMVVRNRTLDRAYLLSNALIVSEQTPGMYYNQIKSPEMTAYFDDRSGSLKRFDALGGAQALLFMEEDSVVTTMNQKDSKIMSATFRDGSIERVHYMGGIKSDAYPLWYLWKKEKEKMKLKDFFWSPELRPVDRFVITRQSISSSVRMKIREACDFPVFYRTSVFFPGYMENVLQEIDGREHIIWKSRNREDYPIPPDKK